MAVARSGECVKSSFRAERFVLDNGLRVLLAESTAIPTISMSVSILSGARDDAEETAGTALLLSRLLDEGTRTRSSLDIADAIESVGGAIDSDCSYERISVFLGVLSKDVDLGLELVADIVTNPALSRVSLEKERDRVLAEIQSAMDRPQVVASWEFNELVYRNHPLHRPVQGYPRTIGQVTDAELRAFHGKHFVPSNAIVSVVGDFRPDDMLSRLERVFAGWGPGRSPGTDHGPLERQREVRRKFVKFDSEQAHIYFGHLGVGRTDPDFYALQVLDTILGGGAGLTARIPRKLRDEQGLAYTTFATITASAAAEPGKFLAYMGTSPENVSRAIDGFKKEIQEIIAEPVPLEELDDAKAYLTGNFVFGFESNSQIARFLVSAEIFELGFDYIEKYPGYINSVTVDDIARVASQHLSAENYSLVVAGPHDLPAEANLLADA